jgi:hypothetical protein
VRVGYSASGAADTQEILVTFVPDPSFDAAFDSLIVRLAEVHGVNVVHAAQVAAKYQKRMFANLLSVEALTTAPSVKVAISTDSVDGRIVLADGVIQHNCPVVVPASKCTIEESVEQKEQRYELVWVAVSANCFVCATCHVCQVLHAHPPQLAGTVQTRAGVGYFRQAYAIQLSAAEFWACQDLRCR